MKTEEPDNQALIACELTTGQKLRDLFIEHSELYPWQAYQLLKRIPSFRGRYQWVRKLFYCAKRLKLILFLREEDGKTQIARQVYKIIPGFENDPRWRNLHAELYPTSAIGALLYAERTEKEGISEQSR